MTLFLLAYSILPSNARQGKTITEGMTCPTDRPLPSDLTTDRPQQTTPQKATHTQYPADEAISAFLLTHAVSG